MALSPTDVSQGVLAPDIQLRVQAAMMNRCYSAYQATANTDPLKQKKRMELCRRAANNQDRYVVQWTWQTLTATTVTTLAAFDDAAALASTVLTLWDQIADLLIFDAEVA